MVTRDTINIDNIEHCRIVQFIVDSTKDSACVQVKTNVVYA